MPNDRLRRVLRQATGSLGALLDKIDVTWFEEHIAPDSRDAYRDEAQRVRIAVAALFAEVVRMDDGIAEGERAQVLNSIAERFDLDPAQATARAGAGGRLLTA